MQVGFGIGPRTSLPASRVPETPVLVSPLMGGSKSGAEGTLKYSRGDLVERTMGAVAHKSGFSMRHLSFEAFLWAG
jgi:hypothetical protein